MVTSQCGSCGAPVPTDARYCPRCGRAVDAAAVPVFDLGTPAPVDPPRDDGPRDRSTTTAIGVVLGVIALVIGLSVLSSGGPDDGGEQAAGSTTSTTSSTSAPRRSAPSTSAPRTTIGPLISGDVLLDPNLGLALVVFRHDGQVVVSDLATGSQQVVADAGLNTVQAVRWVGDTFVAMDLDGQARLLATDGSGEWQPLSTTDGRLDFVWGSATNLLWSPGPTPRLTVVGSGGSLTTFDSPDRFHPWSFEALGLAADRLVFNSNDGIFGLSADGDLRRLGFGRVVGVGHNYLVRDICDDEYLCRLVRDELVAGALAPDRQVALPLAASSRPQRAYPSPDGRTVALLVASPDGMEFQVIAMGDDGTAEEPVTLDVRAFDDWSLVGWVDEGRALAWWDPSNREANVVSRADDGSFVVSIIRASVHSVTNPSLVHVVPLAQLPPGWAPAPPG